MWWCFCLWDEEKKRERRGEGGKKGVGKGQKKRTGATFGSGKTEDPLGNKRKRQSNNESEGLRRFDGPEAPRRYWPW